MKLLKNHFQEILIIISFALCIFFLNSFNLESALILFLLGRFILDETKPDAFQALCLLLVSLSLSLDFKIQFLSLIVLDSLYIYQISKEKDKAQNLIFNFILIGLGLSALYWQPDSDLSYLIGLGAISLRAIKSPIQLMSVQNRKDLVFYSSILMLVVSSMTKLPSTEHWQLFVFFLAFIHAVGGQSILAICLLLIANSLLASNSLYIVCIPFLALFFRANLGFLLGCMALVFAAFINIQATEIGLNEGLSMFILFLSLISAKIENINWKHISTYVFFLFSSIFAFYVWHWTYPADLAIKYSEQNFIGLSLSILFGLTINFMLRHWNKSFLPLEKNFVLKKDISSYLIHIENKFEIPSEQQKESLFRLKEQDPEDNLQYNSFMLWLAGLTILTWVVVWIT